MPHLSGKKAFIFSTSGQTRNASKFHKALREKLEKKGIHVIGEFNYAGFDTFGPLRLVGVIQKGHPTEEDLNQAENYVLSLRKIIETSDL